MLTVNFVRRASFAVVFCVMLGAFVLGFDAAKDLSGPRLPATVLLALLSLGCLVAAGWTRMVLFDKQRNTAEFTWKLFGLTLRSATTPLTSIESVVIREIVLLRRETIGRMLPASEHRMRVYRLCLKAAGTLIRLNESSYRRGLERTATAVAEFLDIPTVSEQL